MHWLLNMRKDNRGATMVIVLITIAVITILGAILLFTSYTGYRIKASQAIGENRFYDAETGVDEIRAGLQGLVSDSISRAYTELMTEFDGISGLDEQFINLFKNDFISAGSGLFIFNGSPDINAHLPSFPGFGEFKHSQYLTNVTFSLSMLEGLMTLPGPGSETALSLSLSDPGDPYRDASGNKQIFVEGEWIPDGPGGRFIVSTIVFRGLRITHQTTNGYLSVVDTDIAVAIPNLSYSRSLLSLGAFADYTIIATGVMDSPAASGTVNIGGSVYVGGLNLDGGASSTGTVALTRGMLVSGGDGAGPGSLSARNGDITVIDRNFTTAPGTSVWARNIRVGQTTDTLTRTGSITLQGNTYVAGSLILTGTRTNNITDSEGNITGTRTRGSSATLTGQYYGYGTGPGAALSSSIIVNGRHTELDLSGLNRLYLAGQSFIEAMGAEVMTGQSMAVRSDQLAYLVPPKLISNMASNPMFYNDINNIPAEEAVPSINYTAPLWEGSDRTLGDYAVTGSYHNVYYPIPGTEQGIRFVFISFPDINRANAYFTDYFQNNTEEIRDYLNIYLDLYAAASNNVQTSGVTYTGTNTGGSIGIIPSQAGAITSLRFYEEYENRRKTLTRDPIPFPSIPSNPAYPPEENPFHYIVLEQPPAGIYSFEGKQTAFVHHGDISLTAINAMLTSPNTISDIKIIICYGELTVDMPYDGLILCDGNIRINNSVNASVSTALRTALLGKINPADAAEKRLCDYLIIKPEDTSGNEKGETWNFTELVYFDNWKKN